MFIDVYKPIISHLYWMYIFFTIFNWNEVKITFYFALFCFIFWNQLSKKTLFSVITIAYFISLDLCSYIYFLLIFLMRTQHWLTPFLWLKLIKGIRVSVSIHQAANSSTIYILWALLSLPTQCFAAARQGSRTNVVMSWPTPAITSVRMRGCAH